jgi:hypothetical protein
MGIAVVVVANDFTAVNVALPTMEADFDTNIVSLLVALDRSTTGAGATRKFSGCWRWSSSPPSCDWSGGRATMR